MVDILARTIAKKLTSAESLVHQAEVLSAALCPTAAHPADCQADLSLHWPRIGLSIFFTFLEAHEVCTALGSCPGSSAEEWSCEEWVDGIVSILESKTDEIVELIKVRDILL